MPRAIFGLSDPWDMRKKRIFSFFEILILTLFIGIFRFFVVFFFFIGNISAISTNRAYFWVLYSMQKTAFQNLIGPPYGPVLKVNPLSTAGMPRGNCYRMLWDFCMLEGCKKKRINGDPWLHG